MPHSWPAPHAIPQAPQFALSTGTQPRVGQQTSPQLPPIGSPPPPPHGSVKPPELPQVGAEPPMPGIKPPLGRMHIVNAPPAPGHMQRPPEQVSPGQHALPTMPQLFGSLLRSRQLEVPPDETHVWPMGQAAPVEPHTQRPPSQDSPVLQRTGGEPQFSGMSLRRHS